MNTSVQERIGRFFPPIPPMPGSDPQRTATIGRNTVPVNAALSINPRYATYYRHLSLAGHGTPLWLPEPNETQHINYRRQGTAIGDVVFFTANGGLRFLFNICRDAHDPINGNQVPDGFTPFEPTLASGDIDRFQEYGEESYLASKSITKKRDRMGPAGLWFQSSASEGAILAMPEGAYSEDLARKSGFDRYLAENLESWYHYVNEVREWGVEQGQLHLVTGVHKAKAWGIATFSNERTAMDLHMIFKSNDNISSGDLYSWEYEGIVDSTRAGPTRRQRRLIFEGLPEAEHEPFENQCLFVRTVNGTVRKSEAVKTDAVIVPASQANNTIFSTTKESSGSAGPNQSSSRLRDGFNGLHDTSASDQLDASDSLSIARNGPVLVRKFWSYLDIMMFRGLMDRQRDHPSKAINEFLLKEKPNGRIAITHDQDWISLLKEDDISLPPGDELVARLKQSCNLKIIVDEGVISLEHKDSQPDVIMKSPGRLPSENHKDDGLPDKPLDPPSGYNKNTLTRDHLSLNYAVNSSLYMPRYSPMQSSGYLSTFEKEPSSYILPSRRRRLSLHESDDDELPYEPLDPNATEQEKIAYKRRQNTLAARRSRNRRQAQFQKLEEDVARLSKERDIWKERALMMERMLSTHGLPCPNFSDR